MPEAMRERRWSGKDRAGEAGDSHGEYRESLGGTEYTNTVYLYSICNYLAELLFRLKNQVLA
jgi:hypothetical protein